MGGIGGVKQRRHGTGTRCTFIHPSIMYRSQVRLVKSSRRQVGDQVPEVTRFVQRERSLGPNVSNLFRFSDVFEDKLKFETYDLAEVSVSRLAGWLPACPSVRPPLRGSSELCWELHGAPFFKMSSLEQRLSRIEEKLKQENEEARRRIDLNIDMSPQRSRPRPSECPLGGTGLSVNGTD